MSNFHEMTFAAKCAPDEATLLDIEKAGFTAVELYTNHIRIQDIDKIIQECKKFSFRYAVHAPTDGYEPDKLAELVEAINAEVVVFHDIYWFDEWKYIAKVFENINTKVCVENIFAAHEPLKLMRRFGLKRCLDMEHLQIQCAGFYEDEFLPIMLQASHIHLTGYIYGSDLWHTHIHYSPEQSVYILNLLRNVGYSGMVVSEARTSLQTLSEFENLNHFYQKWKNGV